MADSGDADLLRASDEVVLPPDPRSARAARAFTTARLDEAGCSDEEKASDSKLCTCVSRAFGGSITVDTPDRLE